MTVQDKYSAQRHCSSVWVRHSFSCGHDECEDWTVKNLALKKLSFELWYWRRLLKSLGPRKFNQSTFWNQALGFLRRTHAKAELQYFSCRRDSMLGEIGKKRDSQDWDGWISWLLVSLSKLPEDWWWTRALACTMGANRTRLAWNYRLTTVNHISM